MARDDVDVRYPPWIRVSTEESLRPGGIGETIIDRLGWDGYGRWFSLRQLMARAPEATLDVSESWQCASLAKRLGMTKKRLLTLLDVLAGVGAIDAESLADGKVFDASIFEQQSSYQSRCRVNRSNRRKADDSSHDSSHDLLTKP